jgi:hypothetical protein
LRCAYLLPPWEARPVADIDLSKMTDRLTAYLGVMPVEIVIFPLRSPALNLSLWLIGINGASDALR